MAIPNDDKGELNDSAYLAVMRELVKLQQKLLSGAPLSAAETERLAQLNNRANQLERAQPDRFNRLVSTLQNEVAPDNTTADGTTDLNSIFSNTLSSSRATQKTTQTVVNYVDLPTPEEFLSDFQNSYNIHLTGLVQTGAIRPEVADFARGMMSEIFGEYLRKQTENLLKGEPLWKVVGLNPDAKLIGARPGAQESTSTTRQESSTTTGTAPATTDTTAASSSTTTAPATTDTTAASSSTTTPATTPTAAPAPSTSAVGQVIEQAGSQNLNLQEESQFNQTEGIVQRNKLAYVPSLGPLDFLKDAATAQRLNLLYAGYKGTAARAARTSAGLDVGGVRRI